MKRWARVKNALLTIAATKGSRVFQAASDSAIRAMNMRIKVFVSLRREDRLAILGALSETSINSTKDLSSAFVSAVIEYLQTSGEDFRAACEFYLSHKS